MNKEPQKEYERFYQMFQRLINEEFNSPQFDDSVYHPADDLEFLESLAADMLTDKEREEFLEHLGNCPSCRQKIADQLKYGGIFDEVNANQTETSNAAKTSLNWEYSRRSLKKFSSILGGVSVVMILLAVGLLFWPKDDSEKASKIELARKNLDASLTIDDFKSFSPNLLDYGYRLSGSRYNKALSENRSSDEKNKKVIRNYQELMKLDSGNKELRKEFARYLLTNQRDIQQAKMLLLTNPESFTEEYFLLGIAEFLLQNDGNAQKYFRLVLKQEPKNEMAQFNLAISLTRSDQFDEAEPLFKEVLETTQSESLQQEISTFLEKRTNDHSSEEKSSESGLGDNFQL